MYTKAKQFINFVTETVQNRKTIINLANNDFKSKFVGSYLGVLWAFATPLLTILVFWFVFEAGFKSLPMENVPFILWFIPAYIAWTFFADAMTATTNTLFEYEFLVKKVKFRVSVLPMVKLLSAVYIHMFFIGFVFLVYIFMEHRLMLQYFQVFYYMFAMLILLIGLGWLTSSLAPFFKDLSQLVNVFLQIGFWLTPIFWSIEAMHPPAWVNFIVKINPMYYITSGYRDCFITGEWFWQRPETTVWFWGVTLATFITGAYVFQKLRPHFADVL
ncbi:ABC transporter permease [Clostridium aminobutyricum]|uniref:Transport permease protein n=1 Tax=Clostridium aminobutyricum TaxID=33953 RepID=A0A939DB73_CLOAM|nr:ABC transporter permease [Clostridium aminobutyricum]MBN7774048.1 ABC transporter permease [Clostridium aminobutyricum]